MLLAGACGGGAADCSEPGIDAGADDSAELVCTAGQSKCAEGQAAVCRADQSGWDFSECASDQRCFEGQCVDWGTAALGLLAQQVGTYTGEMRFFGLDANDEVTEQPVMVFFDTTVAKEPLAWGRASPCARVSRP